MRNRNVPECELNRLILTELKRETNISRLRIWARIWTYSNWLPTESTVDERLKELRISGMISVYNKSEIPEKWRYRLTDSGHDMWDDVKHLTPLDPKSLTATILQALRLK